MNKAEIKYSVIKDEKVTAFMTKIMPYIKADISPENLEYVISFELQKFYNEAYVKGQMSVLEVNK